MAQLDSYNPMPYEFSLRIKQLVIEFHRTTGKSPTVLYVGHQEMIFLRTLIKFYGYSTSPEEKSSKPLMFEGLEVYEVLTERHFRCS